MMIAKAGSLQEMERLQQMLKAGQMPGMETQNGAEEMEQWSTLNQDFVQIFFICHSSVLNQFILVWYLWRKIAINSHQNRIKPQDVVLSSYCSLLKTRNRILAQSSYESGMSQLFTVDIFTKISNMLYVSVGVFRENPKLWSKDDMSSLPGPAVQAASQ